MVSCCSNTKTNNGLCSKKSAYWLNAPCTEAINIDLLDPSVPVSLWLEGLILEQLQYSAAFTTENHPVILKKYTWS